MQFNILEFLRVNKIVLVWVIFGALIWIMRDLFGMVFITFVLSFVICGITRYFTHVLKIKHRRVVVCVIYALLIAAIALFIIKGFPKLMAETKGFSKALPDSIKSVKALVADAKDACPECAPFLDRVMEDVTPEILVSRGYNWGRSLASRSWHFISWVFIGIVFSFLIVFDLPDLMQKFRSLRYTRLSVFYDETVSGVIQFAKVVGENFKAQIYISALNTAFTFAGLTFLEVGTTALLSVIVFACGLIPVMGVFISSVPIMLVALGKEDPHLLGYVLILIVAIHLIEAYILNPRIVSSMLRLNPVITLMILYIAHGLMGLWGMFLGVPISLYIYSQIVRRPEDGHPQLAADGGAGPPGPPDPPGKPASGGGHPEGDPEGTALAGGNGTDRPGTASGPGTHETAGVADALETAPGSGLPGTASDADTTGTLCAVADSGAA
ncbi:MAG: AI-2E family transporter [Deltaproteobacteria bacterium]|jgi:predicted PurR-regulated permease PerM|nr:AI-2E family transporter [Deltaproteobacteria bacterium]